MIGGLFTHFVFVMAFWAALVVKKTGRPFIRGMIIWSFVLLVVMSAVGGGASLDIEGTGDADTRSVFSRNIFWAMPFLAASYVYFQFSKKTGFRVEKMVSLIGCLIIILDFFHLTKCDVTFTQLGTCILSCLVVFITIKSNERFMKKLTPLPLFIISAWVVLLSPSLVEKYGGINAGEGKYNEMSMTSIDSILKKLQRKTVDDRAEMWALTIRYIQNDILSNPIWVKPTPYMEVDADLNSGKTNKVYITVSSHNTMLNLVRYHGFYGGLGLYILFVWYVCRKKNRLFLTKFSTMPIIVTMAVCISQGVIGSHTGHFVVGVPFGTVLFSCLGACWGEQYWRQRLISKSANFAVSNFYSAMS
ncbi:MAG: hypothetical protein ACI4R9_02765 [Kiritimatiellia bacterium]